MLASASPRRREILSEIGILFDVQPSTIEERAEPGESAAVLVERLAREKALDVAQRLAAEPARAVLGADTVVVIDGEILGKPRDASHAVEMLSRLVGRGHQVMTGIALAWSDGRAVESRVVTSTVEMRAATRAELAAYVAEGESLDKAGAYAIQGGASRFITRLVGSRTNVIGLPREETLAMLARGGAVNSANTANTADGVNTANGSGAAAGPDAGSDR
ncbi:MAG: Maf family protein [Myxococcota bacterium]